MDFLLTLLHRPLPAWELHETSLGACTNEATRYMLWLLLRDVELHVYNCLPSLERAWKVIIEASVRKKTQDAISTVLGVCRGSEAPAG